MTKIEIYSKSYCPYCHRAKALFTKKGISYQEYEVSDDPVRLREMRERGGRSTVPQIFINDQHIGGSDALAMAQADGSLDYLLSLKTAAIA